MPSVGGGRSSTPASTSSPSGVWSSTPSSTGRGPQQRCWPGSRTPGISVDLLYLTADSQLVIGGDDPDGIRRVLG